MKKILSIILCVIISTLSFCGCSANRLNVTFEDGSTSKMSAEEIIELKETNGRKYKNISSISGSGTITDITLGDYSICELELGDNFKIVIYENWSQPISTEEWHTFCEQFYTGDKIVFEESYNHFISYNKLCVAVDYENVSIV